MDGITVVQLLLEAEQADTLYRDIYLGRAEALLAPLLEEGEYVRRKTLSHELGRSVRESRTAIERGDWVRARELAQLIAGLRPAVEEQAALLAAGSRVYEPAPLVVDPFSPGLQGLTETRGRPVAQVKSALVNTLGLLEEHDASCRTLYAQRREFFLNRIHLPEGGAAAREPDPSRLQEEAARAVEQGDVAMLDEVLRMLGESPSPPVPEGGPERGELCTAAAGVDEPFPGEAVQSGRPLGLVPVRLAPAERLSEALQRWAWKPSFHNGQITREGGMPLVDLPALKDYPEDMSALFRELLGMFMLHPFVTSNGTRYLPRLCAEQLLIEEFPEQNETSATPRLLQLLGLPRRRALSRQAIDRALLRRGPVIVRDELGLDPCRYRLVCIPFDIYGRLGRTREWGQQESWTHFDGYQLTASGSARALVGGDRRFGGILDLCSISHTDEREGVLLRLAVVRRERLAAG